MSEITLQIPGGIKVINAVPLDPRTRTATLDGIRTNPTYEIGFSPIFNEADSKTYIVSGQDGSGWIFSIFGGEDASKIPLIEKGAVNGVATLDGGGKIPLTQIPSSISGGITIVGFWDADINDPDLSILTPNKGDAYQVKIAGTTILNGISDWQLYDLAVYDDTLPGNWFKITSANSVTSVNGQTGSVVLVTADQSINTHSDVDISAATSGQVLIWDGSKVSTVDIPSSDVTSVNGQTDDVVLTTDLVAEGTNKYISDAELTKLGGIESGAEVNNISDLNSAELTSGLDSSLHYHSEDRNRDNHTGTQTSDTISDFDNAVNNNSNVAANTSKVSASGSIGTHSDVDIAGITNNQILAWDGTKFSPIDESTGLPEGVEGDLLYHNGVDWVVLSSGIDGQVLTSNTGSSPSWNSSTLTAPTTDVYARSGDSWYSLNSVNILNISNNTTQPQLDFTLYNDYIINLTDACTAVNTFDIIPNVDAYKSRKKLIVVNNTTANPIQAVDISANFYENGLISTFTFPVGTTILYANYINSLVYMGLVDSSNSSILATSDTPNTFTNNAKKALIVKDTEDGMEFTKVTEEALNNDFYYSRHKEGWKESNKINYTNVVVNGTVADVTVDYLSKDLEYVELSDNVLESLNIIKTATNNNINYHKEFIIYNNTDSNILFTTTATLENGLTSPYEFLPATWTRLYFKSVNGREYVGLYNCPEKADELPIGAEGDLLYNNGTAWVILSPGTSGNVLKTNGVNAAPSWTENGASTLLTLSDSFIPTYTSKKGESIVVNDLETGIVTEKKGRFWNTARTFYHDLISTATANFTATFQNRSGVVAYLDDVDSSPIRPIIADHATLSDASTTNLEVNDDVQTLPVASVATTLAFTVSSPLGTDSEHTCKRIIDNSSNANAVTLTYSDTNLDWQWNSGDPITGIPANGRLTLEIQVESATNVLAKSDLR